MTTTAHSTSTSAGSLWRSAALSGVAAAAATTLLATVAHEAGVALIMDGEAIPAVAFGQLTLTAVVLGFGLAAALRRWAGRPRRTFVLTTVVLTALSIVPDLMVSVSVGTRLTLVATHLVAAAIVIPVIAARLNEGRH